MEETPDRREFLSRCGMGFGAVGLQSLMGSSGYLSSCSKVSADVSIPLAPKQAQFPGKAKRVIHLFMNGG
ncbi:MAG: DUF1501 domain-containing protein, partial [Verrucomicrobia bacterium]|nr:DUF1501 domain-containing protein [Verrucomicrobiota bacterium]